MSIRLLITSYGPYGYSIYYANYYVIIFHSISMYTMNEIDEACNDSKTR